MRRCAAATTRQRYHIERINILNYDETSLVPTPRDTWFNNNTTYQLKNVPHAHNNVYACSLLVVLFAALLLRVLVLLQCGAARHGTADRLLLRDTDMIYGFRVI